MGLYMHEMVWHLDLAMVLDPQQCAILLSSTGRQSFLSVLSTAGQVGKAIGPSSMKPTNSDSWPQGLLSPLCW